MDEGKRNRNEEHKRWQLRSTVSLRALPSVSFIELQKSMDFFFLALVDGQIENLLK